MGEVIVIFRILPSSIEIFEKVKENLQKLNPTRLEEEPIAFGLKAIIMTSIVPDEGGHMEILENKINDIEGVENVEVVNITRGL